MSSGAARKLRRKHKQRDPPAEVVGPSSQQVAQKYRDAQILVGLKMKIQRGQELSENDVKLVKEMFSRGQR